MELRNEVYNAWILLFQILVCLAMIGTFIVYYRQLLIMKKSSVGQNILAIVNFLQAPYVREARTTVREKLRNKSFHKWTKQERYDASLVCSTYDVVSILIFDQKLVTKEPFIKNWGPSIKDCYEILEDYIRYMQKPEKSSPEYWNDFKLLYESVKR
jgi:hypothetical protein